MAKEAVLKVVTPSKEPDVCVIQVRLQAPTSHCNALQELILAEIFLQARERSSVSLSLSLSFSLSQSFLFNEIDNGSARFQMPIFSLGLLNATARCSRNACTLGFPFGSND